MEEETIRDGWMHKMSHNKLVANKFQKRFFVLTSQTLKYAKTPEAMDEECDLYPLAGAHWIRPFKVANQFADFEIQFPKKILKLKGLDPADTQVWYEEIEHAIKKAQQMDLDPKETSTSTSAKDASPQVTERMHALDLQDPPTSNSAFHQQHLSADTARSDSHDQQQAAAVVSKGGMAAARDDEVQQEQHVHEDLPRRAPSPPRVPTRLPYKALPKGNELDLSAGELPGKEEVEEDRPSPRSMLANPHRFGTLAATSSPKQRQSPPQKVHQAMEDDESGSESEDEPVPHPRSQPGVRGPLSADSPRLSATTPAPAREGGMAGVRASTPDGLRASRERPSSGVAERLSRTLPPRGSLRPRLLQPDAPLPEAAPKPGLHHAIVMQKQNSSGAEESERLELPDRPARSTTAAQPSGGTGSSRSSARSGARPSAPDTHNPESESLVLGPTEGGPHAHTERGSLNRSGGSSAGTHGNASLHSSLGSARAAAPRLLSGAAARAPAPQDERMELPPSRFPPKAPPAPVTPTAANGRGRQQKEAGTAPNEKKGGVGYNHEELEENWDSDEGDGEEDQQARQQREEQERAKAEFLARQQQEQQEQEQQERASGNSWDEDDENGEDTRGSKPRAAMLSHQPSGKPASQRPVVAKAAPQDAEHANSRDVPAHVQAGVTVDNNFAEENWDSDE